MTEQNNTTSLLHHRITRSERAPQSGLPTSTCAQSSQRSHHFQEEVSPSAFQGRSTSLLAVVVAMVARTSNQSVAIPCLRTAWASFEEGKGRGGGRGKERSTILLISWRQYWEMNLGHCTHAWQVLYPRAVSSSSFRNKQFWNRISLSYPSWFWTHSIAQASIKLTIPLPQTPKIKSVLKSQ